MTIQETAVMTMRRGQIGLKAVAALLLALGLFALEAGAQPAVPPQLPPQAADKAKVTVQAQTAPTVSLTAPSGGALYTAPATVLLQATASASSSGKSIAQVEFFAGTALIGTASSAPYSFNWTPVAAGAYSLTARATDNLGAAASSTAVAITVNAPPTVNLTSPGNAAVFNAPATIPLTAAAADPDGNIARVEFYNGTNLIAALTTPPYSINWLLVPAGGYSLTARAIDNLGAVTTSAAVAVTVTQALAQIYYIHTDHLNTPRAIYNQGQQLVWRWDQADPFGGNPPNENPSGLGNFTCNLRSPGQYFDKETNLHYNYFREYDPAIGRYTESDPIGLAGGISTYGYVGGNPLSNVDPQGLFAPWVHRSLTEAGSVGTGLTDAQSQRLANLVASADKGTQGIPDAHRHAMCPSVRGLILTREQCIERYNNFVRDELKKCTLDGLANAIHAFQDSIAHPDFPTYIGMPVSPLHLSGDLAPTRTQRHRATTGTADMIKQWRQNCPCTQ